MSFLTPDQMFQQSASAFLCLFAGSDRITISQRAVLPKLAYLHVCMDSYGTLAWPKAAGRELFLGICMGIELLKMSDEFKVGERRGHGFRKFREVTCLNSEADRLEVMSLPWQDLNCIALLSDEVYRCIRYSDTDCETYKTYIEEGSTEATQKRAKWFRYLWNLSSKQLDSLQAQRRKVTQFVNNIYKLFVSQFTMQICDAVKQVTGMPCHQLGSLTGRYTAESLVNLLKESNLMGSTVLVLVNEHAMRITIEHENEIHLSDVNHDHGRYIVDSWEKLSILLASHVKFGPALGDYRLTVIKPEASDWVPPDRYYQELQKKLEERADSATIMANLAMDERNITLFRQIFYSYRGQSLEDFKNCVAPNAVARFLNPNVMIADSSLFLRACARQDPQYIRLLLTLDILDVNAKNKDNVSGLELAMTNYHTDVVLALLERSDLDLEYVMPLQDSRINKNGFTALELAIHQKYIPILAKLLSIERLKISENQLKEIIVLANKQGAKELKVLAESLLEKRFQQKMELVDEPLPSQEEKVSPEKQPSAGSAKFPSSMFRAISPIELDQFSAAVINAIENADLAAFGLAIADPKGMIWLHRRINRPTIPSSLSMPISFLSSFDDLLTQPPPPVSAKPFQSPTPPRNIVTRLIDLEKSNPEKIEFVRDAFAQFSRLPHACDSLNLMMDSGNTVLQYALENHSVLLRDMLAMPGIDLTIQNPNTGNTFMHDLAKPEHEEIARELAETLSSLVKSKQIVLDMELANIKGLKVGEIVSKWLAQYAASPKGPDVAADSSVSQRQQPPEPPSATVSA